LANYTAEDVKKLREATAAGMLDCKKALDEADGDYAKALDLIRVKGLKGVTKREGRLTSNGAVVAKVEGNLGVMLELNCETDFVAKGERFVALADELLAHLQNAQSDSVEAFLASTMANGSTVSAVVDEANATLKFVELLLSRIHQLAFICTVQAQIFHHRLVFWLNLLRMQLKLARTSHSTLQHLRRSLLIANKYLLT
jgi:translation elongation factor Ts